MACTGNTVYSDYELVTIPAPLWNGGPSATFTIAQQDIIIQQAETWADQNRPTCPSGISKYVYDITFTYAFVTSTGGGYHIYADVVYVCCEGEMPR